jgi:hypothetical protein
MMAAPSEQNGADFIRCAYQAPEDGRPEDLFNPVQPDTEARR